MVESKWKELQRSYLVRLFELSEGNLLKGIPTTQLESELGISDEDGTNVLTQLSSKGLAEFFTYGHARITPRGIE